MHIEKGIREERGQDKEETGERAKEKGGGREGERNSEDVRLRTVVAAGRCGNCSQLQSNAVGNNCNQK